MRKNLFYIAILATAVFVSAMFAPAIVGQTTDIHTQKKTTDKEINKLKGEISNNQREVAQNLASLRQIDEDISKSQSDIKSIEKQVDMLQVKIEGLESSIDTGEKELEVLRSEYLKAVKKMRVAKKKNSSLAFIFSSKSFSQAERRMRYLKEFSKWKERQQDAISEQMAKLKRQHAELSTAKKDVDVALQRQTAARDKLKEQQVAQQEVVDNLKANGEELKNHLARKQAESRKLANQISQLIAEEQAKEAAKKRKADEERAQKEKAEKERQLAEQKKKEAEKQNQMAQQKTSTAPAKETATAQKAPAKPAETAPPTKTKTTGNGEYAEARRRKPRSQQNNTSTTPAKQDPQKQTQPPKAASNDIPASAAVGGSFGSMKGALPRPVAGNFRIVSTFGVHPVSPELPNVMDENPGIDAHVATGAKACSVFDGEVIKIYDRTNTPGYRNIVVVKHGDYITVYANLDALSVKTGQKVKQGQALGVVGTDFDDSSKGLIHFEVWKNQTRLDPATWIR